MSRETYATIARDSLICLAATGLYRDDPERAAAVELAPRPTWQRYPAALAKGVRLAREAIELHGGAKAAERALGLAWPR